MTTVLLHVAVPALVLSFFLAAVTAQQCCVTAVLVTKTEVRTKMIAFWSVKLQLRIFASKLHKN